MSAVILPILVEQGATFVVTTEVTSTEGPLDLTGCSARFTVRPARRRQLPPVLDLSSGDPNEILLGEDGIIVCVATAQQTAAIQYVPARTYGYDLLLRLPAGHIYRLLYGKAVISPAMSLVPDAPMTTPMANSTNVRASVDLSLDPDYSWMVNK